MSDEGSGPGGQKGILKLFFLLLLDPPDFFLGGLVATGISNIGALQELLGAQPDGAKVR